MGKAKSKADPQLKKDPAFMRQVEHLLEQELAAQSHAQTSDAAPAQVTPVQEQSQLAAPAKEKRQPATPPKQPNRKSTETRKTLITELEELIPQLDEAGLEFLVEQARIHLYNMKVDELNSLAQNIGSPAGKTSRKKTQDPGAARPVPVFQIKAGSGGGSYHVSYQGNWKLFSDTEMLAMVRIVQGPGSQEERAARLFRWLRTERRDLLQDIPFQGAQDPLFIEFVSLLQKTFAIRSR